jgi:putative SOS response-associated peptidase YedK
MCGRYMFAANPQQVTERFALTVVPPDLPTSYNVAPQMYMPVIVANSPSRLDIMRWGLVPSWAKDENVGFKTINARAETVAERPAYRAALRYHRCLVPANGFYEWRATRRGKQPYFIHLSDEPLFAFAGLYDIWYSPDGSELRTYTIITCEANALMAPIHNRMPVILPRDAEAAYLDPTETRVAAILPLLQPFTADAMEAYPVSPAVNSPSSDGPTLPE